ncbi:hypothetical protein IJX73_01185 [bacterium]|nr:hypothetical protein [bacterium]
MNTFLKELKIILIYIFIGIFVGYLSLVLVNFIPKDLIRNNVKISSRILIKQGDMPNMFLKGTTLENFTDADAISLTFNKDNNPFYDALYAYNYQLVKRKAFRGVKALKLTAAENTQKLNIYEHSQEWHGYQTLLRPLLIFYDISDLRYLSFLTVQILLILVCFNITKAFNNRFAFIPFLFGFEYFNYTFESITFLFSMDFCIMLLGCLAILKAVEKKKDYKYIGRIFAILAISDSYFSMFNMPILTIAFPLILWLSLTEYKNHSSISQNNKMVLIFTTYWFSAYTLMTSIKIFITKIFLGLKKGVYLRKYY